MYGDYAAPDDWGAGGGGPNGGAGGGLVRLNASSLVLDGQILANGQGVGGAGNGDGSGGSVYLAVATLSGSGSINARGGSGAYPGGGGRVAVYASDLSGFDTSKITAQGAIPASDSVSGSGAGTVYVRDTDEPAGTLIIDALTPGAGWTPLGLPGQDKFTMADAVVIRGKGTNVKPEHPGLVLEFQNSLTVEQSATLDIEGSGFLIDVASTIRAGANLNVAGSLTLNVPLSLTEAQATVDGALTSSVPQTIDGATLTTDKVMAPQLSLINGAVLTSFASTTTQMHMLGVEVNGTLSVDATSSIDVTGKGYVSGRTTGNTTVGGATSKAAASYGGLGETGPGASTNAVYGDYADPNDWGSGGGGPAGGAGGGLVRIHAETLVLDGQILSNGQAVGGFVSGDGSGGGIYISVNTLSGSGSINARGGSGSYPAGGGRIAVYASDLSGFDSSRITSQGDIPASDSVNGAGAGTVYLRDPDRPAGTLIIDALGGTGSTPLGLPGHDTLVISDAVLIRDEGTKVALEHAGQRLEFQNSLTITNSASLQYTEGMIINGVAYLGSLDGSTFGSINVVGAQSLEGTGTIVFGGNPSNAINATSSNGDSGTLTIGSGITIRGSKGSVGSSGLPLVNQGIISADVAGGTFTLRSSVMSNSGSIEANNGSALSSVGGSLTNTGIIDGSDTSTVSLKNSSVTFNSPGILIGQPSASIEVTGSIFGDTTDRSLFQPSGTVSLSGTGTSAIPQFFEVMGQDLGNVPAGFTSNFAYGGLSVGANDYVRLVDLQKNSGTSNPEALYVNTLVVSSGSTLDLNGLKIYYRAGEINGTVTAGSATPLLGGGPLPLNSFAPGNLQAAGEIDNWNFFGRAGQQVDVFLHTGSSGTPAPIQPALAFGQITLVDPSGQVVNVASNSESGVDASILNGVLSIDGTYRVQVQAGPSQASSTGNYVVGVYDATVHTMTASLNQTVNGQIDSPYSQDHWTFSAVANQQIKFDLLAAANPSIKFELTGPGGYVGFTGLSTSSDLLTLPTSGTYTVSASGGAGAYAFRLDQTSQVALALGTSYQGTLAGSGQAQLFSIAVAQAQGLLVVLQDSTSSDQNELYLKFGSPPTRSDYQYRFSNAASANQQVLVPLAAAGNWYALLYANSVPQPSTYTILATTSDVFLTGSTPNRSGTSADTTLTLTGSGFDQATTVELVAASGTVYPASTTSIDLPTQITATFAAGTVPAGVYSVEATKPGVQPSKLANALTIDQGGEANLKTDIVLPSLDGLPRAGDDLRGLHQHRRCRHAGPSPDAERNEQQAVPDARPIPARRRASGPRPCSRMASATRSSCWAAAQRRACSSPARRCGFPSTTPVRNSPGILVELRSTST